MKSVDSPVDRYTLWIVSHDAHASSYRVWRGPRTVAALDRELKKERHAGRVPHLELESGHCSPVVLDLEELQALGIITTTPPRGRDRSLLAALAAIVLGAIVGCGTVTTADVDSDAGGGGKVGVTAGSDDGAAGAAVGSVAGAGGTGGVGGSAGGIGAAGTVGTGAAAGTTGAGGLGGSAAAGTTGTGNTTGAGNTSGAGGGTGNTSFRCPNGGSINIDQNSNCTCVGAGITSYPCAPSTASGGV